MSRALELVRRLGLAAHPEGGHYRELHRSAVEVASPRGTRRGLTTIYFLLARGERSRWHRVLGADEAWHFYEGDPLELLWVEGLTLQRHVLAPVGTGDGPVAVVPAGAWQAARPLGEYALVGCSVGPGFDFADFEMLAEVTAERTAFEERFPEVAALV